MDKVFEIVLAAGKMHIKAALNKINKKSNCM